MYFGSVRFFRHLILLVIALLILIPIIICVVLFNDNLAKQAEIDELRAAAQQGGYTVDSGSSDVESVLSVPESSADSQTDSSDDRTVSQSEPEESGASEATTEPTVTESVPQSSSDVSSEAIPPQEDPYPDMYVERYTGDYINDVNTAYLTFDDGPSSLTGEILHYLDKTGVKATFFVVPDESEECARLLRQISDAGHMIGIHSYSHDYEKIYADPDAFLEDFNKAYEIVYEATGSKPFLYRFAGGSINDYNGAVRDDIIKEMDRRGFVYFDWNVDSNDWQGYGWQYLYDNVTADACALDTPVILFHDTGDRMNTVLVIEDIISSLKNKGYTFAALSEQTEPVQF